jgi:ABC-type bacteriocin/lantibiotic exporter with double-glycine peptidase domain
LFDNVRFGQEWVGPAELDRAARAAVFDSVVKRLPGGWETKVGGRWEGLSGGEKRRLALCRALVHQPSLLLLDETLGALEPELRKTILERLREFDRNLAVLMVSHDANDVRFCDRIFAMNGGRLVECASSVELSALRERRHRGLNGGGFE